MSYEHAFWYLLVAYATSMFIAHREGFLYPDQIAMAIGWGLAWPALLLISVCIAGYDTYKRLMKS